MKLPYLFFTNSCNVANDAALLENTSTVNFCLKLGLNLEIKLEMTLEEILVVEYRTNYDKILFSICSCLPPVAPYNWKQCCTA